jgi:transposase
MDEGSLRNENAELRVRIEQLERALAASEERNRKLLDHVESLQRGTKRQAAPFSKGPPKPYPKTPGRKPGDAYGRQVNRSAPPCIDEVYDAPLPERCPICESSVDLESVELQYQTEIPRRPICRQFNVHVGRCTCCRKRLQGRHPLQTSNALGAAANQIGPDAQSLATILNKEAGLSHGKIQAFFRTAFGIVIARATSVRTMLRAALRCLPAFKEIQVAVKHSDWCVPDETGWKVGGLLQWLHGFVTEDATLYLIRDSRGFDVAEEALGADYAGALTHDGWKPYEHFEFAVHGQCNAHLLRRCKHLLETATCGAVIFPRQVKTLLLKGLALRDERDAQTITLKSCAKKARKLSRTLESLCGPKTHPGNEQFAKFLYQRADEVFNYLHDPRLDATNWRAEQAVRPAVVNRKVWGGNRTEDGAEAQGRLTSVFRTCWQRGLHALDFLSKTLRAQPGHVPKLLLATN